MGEPGDMDDLFAGAQHVEAEPHDAGRAVGLGVALVAVGATVAFIVVGTAQGLLLSVVAFFSGVWPS